MSEPRSVIQALRALLPLVPRREKWRFWGLLALAVISALGELA